MEKQALHTKLPKGGEKSREERFEAVTFESLRPLTFKEIVRKYRNGLYCSVIGAMLLVIFLLGYKINTLSDKSGDFMVINMLPDIPAKQPEEVPVDPKEKLSKEVDEILRNARSTSVRNAVVNTDDANKTTVLKDAKGINSSVYDEAQKLQEKLDANRRQQDAYRAADNAVPVKTPTAKAQTQTYQGPSVLSFTLAGRSAVSMPIPAYKCETGGDVVVIVQVNRRGYVTSAKVDVRRSAADPAMHEAAISSAEASRFTPDDTAPNPQQGEIVYRFVAQ